MTRTGSGGEGGCLYSEGSSRAAGHQSTDKPDVECRGWMCRWHRFSHCPDPAIPHLLPKPSLARKFTHCCPSFPSHRHLKPWCPRDLPSCCAPARGCSLGAQGLEQFPPPSPEPAALHCGTPRGTCQPLPIFTARFTSTCSARGYLLCPLRGR